MYRRIFFSEEWWNAYTRRMAQICSWET